MKKSLLVLFFPVFILAACVMPNIKIIFDNTPTPGSPDEYFTQVAQTVAAKLTSVAILATPTSNIPTNSITPTNSLIPSATYTSIPTNTSLPTFTKSPTPCNLATWDPATIDVTIPDNSKMVPNQVFSKTWRIRNVGTCSWNSNYLLIFDHGDGLGVTPGYAQQLTPGFVNPGQWVDLTVNNFKAPSTPGTYTGYWRLRDPYGNEFGITLAGGTFAVRIVVIASTTITLLPILGESGTVHSDGPVKINELSIGDTTLNFGIQLFLSYDISSIPSNATIVEVKHDMRNSIIKSNPFSLVTLSLYQDNYGTLDTSDYVVTIPTQGKLADWSSPGALDIVEVSAALKKTFQNRLGASRIQFRLQFTNQTNNNGIEDVIAYNVLPSPNLSNITGLNPAIIVTYTVP